MGMVYIIGGGPCAGKSSIAKALSKQYELEYWRGDDFAGVHQREAAKSKYPVNNYLESLDENEQSLELLKLTAKQELARQEELFFMMLKELRRRKFDRLLLEGNFLLPDLVSERFERKYRAIWVVPTRAFQEQLYSKRPWAPKLLRQDSNPKLALESWIQRDWEFNQEVIKQAKRHHFPCLKVDGKKPLLYSIRWATQRLELQEPTPDKA